jgi:uncharacterized protein
MSDEAMTFRIAGPRRRATAASGAARSVGLAADWAREALDHYNQAIERLKSQDWAGFGAELDRMHGLLEDLSRAPGGR